jgi:hypothetical protein
MVRGHREEGEEGFVQMVVLEGLDEAKDQNGHEERSQTVHASMILELRLIANLLVRIPCFVLWRVNPSRKQHASSRSMILDFWCVAGEQKQSNLHGGTGNTREKRGIRPVRLGAETCIERNNSRCQTTSKVATIKRWPVAPLDSKRTQSLVHAF